MEPTDQVVFVLHLSVALGPLAVYFLTLGLVNSQAHPCVVRSRNDFLLLSVVVVPLAMVPAMGMAIRGWIWPVLVLGIAVAACMTRALWRPDRGWVIYNADLDQVRRLLERVSRRLGWSIEGPHEQLQVRPVGLELHLRAFPWLRNVTLELQGDQRPASDQRAAQAMMDALTSECRNETLLPSPAGASLVVIGTGLLAVPIWHLFRHIDAIAEVVRRVLFA